jgi:hypothetical protein
VLLGDEDLPPPRRPVTIMKYFDGVRIGFAVLSPEYRNGVVSSRWLPKQVSIKIAGFDELPKVRNASFAKNLEEASSE